MNIAVILLSTLCGIAIGYFVPFSKGAGKLLDEVMACSMYALIGLMGIKLGLDDMLFSYIAIVGLQALALAAVAIAGSVVAVLIFERIVLSFGRVTVFGDGSGMEVSDQSPLKMAAIVFAFLLGGVVCARIIPQMKGLLPHLDLLITVGLCFMVLVAGIGIGRSKNVIESIKRVGVGMFIVPVSTVVGSILSCMLIAPLLGITVAEGGVVGGSMGWYTLSGMMLTNVSVKLGALAFLSNMFREAASLLLVPFIAKRFGPFAAVAPCGCTCMDSTLPIVVRSTSPQNAVLAFSSGVILSLAVPVIINLFMPFL